MKNPCAKDCPCRNESCHGKCKEYQEYFAWCEEKRKERYEEREKQYAADVGYRRNVQRKWRKSKNNGH